MNKISNLKEKKKISDEKQCGCEFLPYEFSLR